MNCKKWLAVQDQDAVSLNIIVYIEWVVQVSSAHPVSSTDIHWQKLCRALTWSLHVFATFVRHNLCSCMFWFLYVLISWFAVPVFPHFFLFHPVSSFTFFCKCPFLHLFTPTPSFPHILLFLVAPQILTPTLEIPNFRGGDHCEFFGMFWNVYSIAQGEAIEQSQTTTRKAHKNLDQLLCRLSRARKKCI